jgi:hypothetical protein
LGRGDVEIGAFGLGARTFLPGLLSFDPQFPGKVLLTVIDFCPVHSNIDL